MATERPGSAELRLTRLIDAPREVVFEVWTRPEHLVEWWGPAGFSLPSCELDFRAGGAFRYQMRGPAGEDHWLRGVFREIVEPERIAFTFAWGDAERATGPVTLVMVSFEAHHDKTRVVLHQTGLESESSARAHEGGWSTQLVRLAEFAAARWAARDSLQPSRPIATKGANS
jgi:uncharacterized protein YndB with AHSA1/START domain